MAKVIGQFAFEYDYSNYDFKREQEREKEWLASLKLDLRKFHKPGKPGSMVGEELFWQRADGHARYIITSEKPFRVAHLHIGDGYQVEPETIRGFRLSDAKVQVKRNADMKAIFS